MPTMTVSRDIGADTEAVWALLADFGNVSWIPVAAEVQVAGDGPGMRRIIPGTGDQPAVEKLEWIDHERHALAYEIEQSPLPVSRFVAVVTVTDGDATNVTWQIEFEPRGDDESVREGIERIYTAMAGWLDDAASA